MIKNSKEFKIDKDGWFSTIKYKFKFGDEGIDISLGFVRKVNNILKLNEKERKILDNYKIDLDKDKKMGVDFVAEDEHQFGILLGDECELVEEKRIEELLKTIGTSKRYVLIKEKIKKRNEKETERERLIKKIEGIEND